MLEDKLKELGFKDIHLASWNKDDINIDLSYDVFTDKYIWQYMDGEYVFRTESEEDFLIKLIAFIRNKKIDKIIK